MTTHRVMVRRLDSGVSVVGQVEAAALCIWLMGVEGTIVVLPVLSLPIVLLHLCP